jgi:hypothetical protein
MQKHGGFSNAGRLGSLCHFRSTEQFSEVTLPRLEGMYKQHVRFSRIASHTVSLAWEGVQTLSADYRIRGARTRSLRRAQALEQSLRDRVLTQVITEKRDHGQRQSSRSCGTRILSMVRIPGFDNRDRSLSAVGRSLGSYYLMTANTHAWES